MDSPKIRDRSLDKFQSLNLPRMKPKGAVSALALHQGPNLQSSGKQITKVGSAMSLHKNQLSNIRFNDKALIKTPSRQLIQPNFDARTNQMVNRYSNSLPKKSFKTFQSQYTQ